jgi:hypothetical protein
MLAGTASRMRNTCQVFMRYQSLQLSLLACRQHVSIKVDPGAPQLCCGYASIEYYFRIHLFSILKPAASGRATRPLSGVRQL